MSTQKKGDKPAPKKVVTAKPAEMDPELIEFITAMDDYKRIHSRPFPTWGEVLNVLRELGYEKAA